MRVGNPRRRRTEFIAAVFILGLFTLGGGRIGRPTVDAVRAQNAASKPQAQTDPWTVSETVTPADLAKELSDPKPAKRPVVACVGFKFLYDGGHVPGASYHGPGSKPEGLADLKTWAQDLPRSSNVVLYCGCCPLVRCPNLRPAFTALHDAGFVRLRVLLLPTNFATDWAGKGYPTEKSKP
jgi:thiosulfate/3-mercaptopyruvate sulfurtransferase